MGQINIPNVGMIITVIEDWEILVPWFDRNLRMLAAYKLTGMSGTAKIHYSYDMETRKPKQEQILERKTVKNPLFMDFDGKYQPALIVIPSGTKFSLTKYHTGYQGRIIKVGIKCAESPKKGIKGLCLELPLEEFNKMNGEFITPKGE
jgi:hypothetical protein